MGWRLDFLLHHCADLAVDVEWMDLGPQLRGGYDHDQGLIVLNTRLTAAQATATLAHECGHQAFGDVCSTPAVERRAWEFGASLVITPRQYADAEYLVGSHDGALATELEVTPRLIKAWRAWFQKRLPVERRVQLATTLAVSDD